MIGILLKIQTPLNSALHVDYLGSHRSRLRELAHADLIASFIKYGLVWCYWNWKWILNTLSYKHEHTYARHCMSMTYSVCPCPIMTLFLTDRQINRSIDEIWNNAQRSVCWCVCDSLPRRISIFFIISKQLNENQLNLASIEIYCFFFCFTRYRFVNGISTK